MDRLVELVAQLEPDSAPPPPEARARQRAALFQSMEAAEQARPHPARWRPRRGGWFLAIAGAAAAAAVGVAALPGWLSGPGTSPRSPSQAPAAGTSAVLTAVTRALGATVGDVEEARSTVSVGGLDSTAWVDIATGACRVDTSVGGETTLTVFVEDGQAVVIDHVDRRWWSRGSEGLTCAPLTPQTIEQDLAAGQYTLAGLDVIDGRQTLRLESTTTTSGLHPVTRPTTLWVDAATYLPIRSTSTGHVTDTTAFTWLPATAANQAVLTVTVPPGFQHVGGPAPSGPSVP